MISSLVRSVCPRAGVAAVLLVAVVVPAAPAAAAPVGSQDHTAIYAWSRAVYPYAAVPGFTGSDPALPADAGPAPGSVSLVVEIQNNGTDALRDITVATRLRPGGQIDHIDCATTPPASGETEHAARQRVLPQRVPPQRPTARQRPSSPASPSGASATWTDPVDLAPYETLYCSVHVSGITDDVVHDDTTVVTAVGAATGEPVIYSTYTYIAAGALRPRPPGPISLGYLVWVDPNSDNIQQVDQGEPGLPGQRLSITGPDGLPPHDYPSGDGVVGPLTTSRTGTYHFRNLRPFTTYTVTLDLSSPALANLVKSPNAPGEVSPDHSTWSMNIDTGNRDVNFGKFAFVAKNPLKLTVSTPLTAVAGTSVQVTGAAWRPGPGGAWDGHAVLEFQPGGTTDFSTWTKVADATSHRGHLTTRVTATRSGWFRYRVPGDSSTVPAVSRLHHLVVDTAPVALTAAAPATVRPGASLTVAGTITRAGEPFRTTRTVLEQSPDASTWTAVADVRSTDGTLMATVEPTRSGFYRFRYRGDSRTAAGTSPARQVVVTTAAPASPPHPTR